MNVQIVQNGVIKIILTGETEFEREALKQINGATATTISDGMSILGSNVAGGLLLKMDEKKDKS